MIDKANNVWDAYYNSGMTFTITLQDSLSGSDTIVVKAGVDGDALFLMQGVKTASANLFDIVGGTITIPASAEKGVTLRFTALFRPNSGTDNWLVETFGGATITNT